MTRTIFVNLPVADLDRSRAFFRGLGFEFDGRLEDERATCMVVNDRACVMLLTRPFFARFAVEPTGDGAVLALSADSRDDVDALVDEALASGGRPGRATEDHGFLYGRSFRDPDGHLWEVLWMDPVA